MNLFHDELMCAIEGITFQDDGIVILTLSRGHCTDMMGAVEFVHRLIGPMRDYKLEAIICEAEDEPSYAYLSATKDDDEGTGVFLHGRWWVYREEPAVTLKLLASHRATTRGKA